MVGQLLIFENIRVYMRNSNLLQNLINNCYSSPLAGSVCKDALDRYN